VLSITPRVGDKGRILLEVEQEASDVVRTETSGIDSSASLCGRLRGSAAVRLKADIGRMQPQRRSQRGFVLLVVLSVLGLIAVVAASFAQVARNHMRLAAVASEGAKAEALADAGVHIAILDLVAARDAPWPARRFALDATPVACSIGGDGAILTLAVQDEAGKVDLNIERPPRGGVEERQEAHPAFWARFVVVGVRAARR
jgi:hypothetical protein